MPDSHSEQAASRSRRQGSVLRHSIEKRGSYVLALRLLAASTAPILDVFLFRGAIGRLIARGRHRKPTARHTELRKTKRAPR